MTKRTEWDYIVDVKMPAALKSVEPGKLHASLLRDIPTGGKLFYLAADAWNAMVEAAKADGVELKPTSSGDLYRSYDSQKAGFLSRYSLQDTGTGSTKTFEGKTWYLKKGMAMLATPGKSQHNLGLAVDIANASEKKRINWLIANVEKFGWSWEVVPSEPWHIRYVCGDAVPQAVKDYVARNPKPGSAFGSVAEQKAAAEQRAATPAANVVAAANKPNIVKDNKGKAVKEAQSLLDKHGFACKPDGDFGPKTQEIVKQFQKAKGIPVTGDVDQPTWAALLA
jgi:hypothetical protein